MAKKIVKVILVSDYGQGADGKRTVPLGPFARVMPEDADAFCEAVIEALKESGQISHLYEIQRVVEDCSFWWSLPRGPLAARKFITYLNQAAWWPPHLIPDGFLPVS